MHNSHKQCSGAKLTKFGLNFANSICFSRKLVWSYFEEMAAAALPGSKSSQAQHEEVGALVQRLIDPQKREIVLQQLSKKRETFPYLAPMLWHSVGTIAVLLQEIISIYPALNPPTLDNAASSRVCNALALLQCVAGHSETRKEFLKGL